MDAHAAPPAVPLTIELELVAARTAHGTLHVEGTARGDDGATRPFSGWMALLQLLEGLADIATRDGATRDGATRDGATRDGATTERR
jgi:hypothetical protein